MSHNRRQTMISDAIDSVSDKAKEAVEGTAEMVGSTADKAKDLAANAKEKAKEIVTDTGELAVHAKNKMGELGATAAQKASAAVQEVGHELTDLIRRYPIQSLLAGVAVGFMLARTTYRD